MLYGLLLTLFIFLCFFIILIVLVQKSRSSMGMGGLGGGAQMLFGGSGGQDLFQKITWVCVALFMLGSLGLAVLKTKEQKNLVYNIRPKMPATQPVEAPAPVETTEQAAAQSQAPEVAFDASAVAEQAPLVAETEVPAQAQPETVA